MLQCHMIVTIGPDKAHRVWGSPRQFDRGKATMRVGVLLFVSALTVCAPALGSEQPLEGEALRKVVAGKTVNLETPLGGLPISFRHNGTMHGKTAELAYYTGSTQDRGVWWIVADKLVESRMGAVAWGRWPAPRFPSPLIKPSVPISGTRLSDWLHHKAHDGRPLYAGVQR
jgi:hypothetical protein